MIYRNIRWPTGKIKARPAENYAENVLERSRRACSSIYIAAGVLWSRHVRSVHREPVFTTGYTWVLTDVKYAWGLTEQRLE